MFKAILSSIIALTVIFVFGAAACTSSAANSNTDGVVDTNSERDNDSGTDSVFGADTDTDTATDSMGDGSAIMHEFGEVTVQPTTFFEGWGENVDAIAAWRNNNGDTQIFITSKDTNAIGKFDLDGTFVDEYPQDTVNGIIVFEEEIYLSQDSGDHQIFVYDATDFLLQRTFSGETDMTVGGEHDLDICSAEFAGGKNVAWVSDDSGTVTAYDANSGEKLYDLKTGISEGLEEIEVIEHGGHCSVVIANENLDDSFGFQVWRADAQGAQKLGEFGEGMWQDDSEGVVAVTASDGSGYLFSTEQGPSLSKYHIYRFDTTGSSFEYTGTLILEGIAKTDGISAFQWPVPDAPNGMFLAIDNDTRGVAIPLHVIFDATGLGLNG